jgi:hypothetical protein
MKRTWMLALLLASAPLLATAKRGGDQVGNGRVDEIVLCRKDPVLKKDICVTKKKRNEIEELLKAGWVKTPKPSKPKLPDSFKAP